MPPPPDLVSITLNRTGGDNSLSSDMVVRLRAALERAADDPGVAAVVIQGRAGSFCTGMDLAEAAGPDDDPATAAGAFFDLLTEVSCLPTVVVAAVDGQVAGGGVGLVAACDLVIASARSVFSLPEALWGLLPCCVHPFLARRIGDAAASRLAVTTMPIGAAEAMRLGLVDVEAADVTKEIRRYGARLRLVDRDAVGAMKALRSRLVAHPDAAREIAVDELARRLAEPAVRRRLEHHAATGRLPWEADGARADGQRG